MSHTRWKLTRDWRLVAGGTESPEAQAIHVEIRMASVLGLAVYERRTALGISQSELGKRAEMTQPEIFKIELGGTIPTLPLLARLAKALDASLNIALDGDTSTVVFTPHTA
ncbi:helix-turn-helix transcriptional regulator [Embleya sp. NPDC050154]|uniref:helix-turn-helix transcriptional regulator n=1 Tax=Embleya sp. NPDC050154 TaxID=3363988 RepID=UPI0037919A43